jgi:hypothetical protein
MTWGAKAGMRQFTKSAAKIVLGFKTRATCSRSLHDSHISKYRKIGWFITPGVVQRTVGNAPVANVQIQQSGAIPVLMRPPRYI